MCKPSCLQLYHHTSAYVDQHQTDEQNTNNLFHKGAQNSIAITDVIQNNKQNPQQKYTELILMTQLTVAQRRQDATEHTQHG